MEIIDELEPVRRGPYAGAVGYLNYGGASMDTAITIRTLVAWRGKGYVQAGAGIVADSDPDREFEETLNKARALLRAAAMVRGARAAFRVPARQEMPRLRRRLGCRSESPA
jgi:anthranilate synthase component I